MKLQDNLHKEWLTLLGKIAANPDSKSLNDQLNLIKRVVGSEVIKEWSDELWSD